MTMYLLQCSSQDSLMMNREITLSRETQGSKNCSKRQAWRLTIKDTSQPHLVERLWAPTKSLGFSQEHAREAEDTRGLSYPFDFVFNVISAIILGNSSNSEDGGDEDNDKDLLVPLPEARDCTHWGKVLETLTQRLEADADKITDITPAPKQLKDSD